MGGERKRHKRREREEGVEWKKKRKKRTEKGQEFAPLVSAEALATAVKLWLLRTAIRKGRQ